MGKLVTRFADWVDSFGTDAGDYMVGGMVFGGMVAGGLGIVVSLMLSSPALLIVGIVACIGHLLYAMAAL